MFSQIGRDVPGPQIVKIARLPAANNSDRFALEEVGLRVKRRTEE
jgi:hypothetical protein